LLDIIILGLHHARAPNRGPINKIGENGDDEGDRNKQHAGRTNVAQEPTRDDFCDVISPRSRNMQNL
jgi:hypothetical protein